MTFSPTDWWGSKGCRFAGQPGHVCLDVWGQAAEHSGKPCVMELRAAMRDDMDRIRAVAPTSAVSSVPQGSAAADVGGAAGPRASGEVRTEPGCTTTNEEDAVGISHDAFATTTH